ncbi:germin-like protein subfamily 3 member 2 [Aristolochia californica]|uniref:germin-like protein subfamily 3 member 2 n=1 Tax=Aristolochia californica TaxID=171875 RepID=UPI0035E03384
MEGKRMSSSVAILFFLLVVAFTPMASSDPDPVQDFCVPVLWHGPNHTVHPIFPLCKNSSEVTVDDFVFSGIKSPGDYEATGFSGISVNPTVFPGLNTLGMSFVRADLDEGGVNVPHYHPRATEIAVVLEGTVYSGFVDSTNRVFAKVIEKGEVMVFPKGLVHFQMNVGDSPATIFGSFNSQNPGQEKLPLTLFGSGIEGKLLEKAFGLSKREVENLRRRFGS